MKDPIMNKFNSIEIEKRKMINSLMCDWRNAIPSIKIKFPDDNKNYPAKDYFASDGFYPKYYSQKIRVLFIGRETRWISGGDCIATVMLDYFPKRNDHNQMAFTRHILYIVEGIKNKGTLEFKDVKKKTANGIAKEMESTNDYGYASMNISKYSNDSKGGAVADKKLINSFLEHSFLEKRNFFQEEIAILNPHVIITGNLLNWKIEQKYLDFCFGKRKKLSGIPGIADAYEINISKKKIKLIDLYHFSSRFSDKEYFYDPIMKLLFHGRKKG